MNAACTTLASFVLFACSAQQASTQAALLSPAGGEIERNLREAELGYDIAERRYVLGGKLSEGGEARHSFLAKADATYFGIALCDEACGDIDLVVEDEAGNVLDNDEADGAEPVLLFQVENAARIHVLASMKECGKEACEYGLAFHVLRGTARRE